MELHYEHAYNRFLFETNSPPDHQPDPEATRPVELLSVKMDELHRSCWLYGHETPFADWLTDRRQPKFENQVFHRGAIIRWLSDINMQSIYPFSRNLHIVSTKQVTISGRWPWGDHHTEMLGHLEAAAIRFWTSYVPADATTANTNATVSEWLQTERKVSRTMADSIASMLRADGLPTGPRK